MNDTLHAHLEELEMRIAFQDGTIEELNQELIKLNDLVARQQYQMQLIIDKLRAIEPSHIASQSEETPPHY
ncbi:MAG: SlyX family protein [Shewanella sp.]|nr:SlyX family protein [Shewanella sp.]MCF1430036.1 SlyX family protein [Shewanella sp.]MCF1438659.1 SlyX family protein [Shewanella sp.]MCF1458871.1 SlyX family protein [Shewanella sp.]